MDSFIKDSKMKLSAEKLIEMMKDSKVIEEGNLKEEDVRATLKIMDPNALLDVDEIVGKLDEISKDLKLLESKESDSDFTAASSDPMENVEENKTQKP